MNPTDLFFIVLAAVIMGGSIVAFATAALVRFSRAEDAGKSGRFSDMFFVVIALAFVGYGMWRAGIFT